MALDLTCFATRQANRSEATSASVGWRRVTTRKSSAAARPESGSWTRSPRDAPDVVSDGSADVAAMRMSRRSFFFRRNSRTGAGNSGARSTSVKISLIFCAASTSSGRFTAMMPPNGILRPWQTPSHTPPRASGPSHTARVGMLDDDHGRFVEFRYQQRGGGEVDDIVEGELLPCSFWNSAPNSRRGPSLVRVLAVPELQFARGRALEQDRKLSCGAVRFARYPAIAAS